jgi:hypothetical protein
MALPFEETFRLLTNVQLLEVVRNAGEYDPEAVRVARQLLSTREVTAAEYQAEEEIQAARQHWLRQKALRRELVQKARHLIQPLQYPEESLTTNKWYRILLLCIVLRYVIALWLDGKYLRCLHCPTCRWYPFDVLFLLPLVYLPVFFYLLVKKRKWGWILIFSDTLLSAFSSATTFYMLFAFSSIIKNKEYATSLALTALYAGLAIFLWKDQVSMFFHVSQKTKVNTLLVIGVFCGASILYSFL